MKLLKLRWLRILLVAFIIATVLLPIVPQFHVSIPSFNVSLPEISVPWGTAQKWVDEGREWFNARIDDANGLFVRDINFGPQPAYADSIDLYWVGGTGSWSQTAHWSASSGGAGGHAVPTATNAVIFDANSDSGATTITIGATATCKSMNWSAIDSGITWAGTYNLSIVESLVLKAPATLSITYSGTITFTATSGVHALTFAGNTLHGGMVFNGIGGTWQPTDTLTFNDGGTSTKDFWLTNGSFSHNNKNVVFIGDYNIAGALTFYDLTVNNVEYNDEFALNGNITVANTLTVAGISSTSRALITSTDVDSSPTPRTITAASLVSSHADYWAITAAGTADWDLSGDDSIDFGSCTGITVTYPYVAGCDLYWYNYTDSIGYINYSNWSDVSGGYNDGGSPRHAPPNSTNNVFFDSQSFEIALYQDLTLTDMSCNDMDWTGVSAVEHHITVGNDDYLRCYGNVTLAPTLTWYSLGGSEVHFCFNDTGTTTFDTAGASLHNDFSGYWFIGRSGGTVELLSDIYSPDSRLTFECTTLIPHNYTVTITNSQPALIASGLTFYDVNMTASGTSAFTLSGDNTFHDFHVTLTSSTRTNGVTISGTNTFNNLTITDSSSVDPVTFSGANTFNDLTIAKASALILANDQIVAGDLTLGTSMAPPYRLYLCSSVYGTQRTITVSGVLDIERIDIKDIINGGDLWDLSTEDAGDAGNNTNIIFKPSVSYYWHSDSGNWSNGSMWFTETGGGGTSGVVPLLQDIAVFDVNSFTMSTRTVTFDMARIGTIRATEVLYTPTFYKSSSLGVYGDITLGISNWNVTYTDFRGVSQVLNTGTTIDSAGTPITGGIAVYCVGGSLLFDSNVVASGSIVLYGGLLDFYNHNVVASTFVSTTATYARSLSLGSGTFTLNSTAAVDKWDSASTNFTLNNSTGTIILTNSSTNTQVFDTCGFTNYSNITVTGIGAYTLTFTGNMTMNVLTIDRSSASKTIRGDSSTARTIILNNLVIPLAGTTTIGIGGGSSYKLNITKAPAGPIMTDYLTLNYSTASPGTLTFYAGTHSTAASSPGWILSDYTLPLVSTLGATLVNKVTATLNGDIAWVGAEPTVYVSFEYGYTTSYGTTTVEQSFNTVASFSQVIINLTSGTTYHYRARLHYGVGPTWLYGQDQTFTTHAEPIGTPQILTVGITNLSGTSATFIGTLASMGYFSLVYAGFEYGLTTAYGATTTEAPFTGAGPVLQDVTNLVVGETYHYRAYVRYNNVNYTYGVDKSFTSTLTILPIAVSLSPVNVTDTTATFQGSVDNMGNAIQVWASFEYGSTVAYGSSTPEQTITTAQSVSQAIMGLVATTGYHYRLRVRYTASDYVYGTDIAFTTTGAGVPGTQGPDVLAIVDAKVVTGYLTPGDQMYLVSYKCIYLNGTPVVPASEYFVIQILNNSVVIGQWPLPQWGYQPVGLYLAPQSAPPYGGLYTIKIVGIPIKWPVPPVPEATRTLTGGDWLGGDLTQLDNWVIQTAVSIGTYYNEALVTYTATGTVLNATGGALFNNNISGLSKVRPQLFSVFALRPTPKNTPSTGTAYTDTWNPSTQLGPYVNGLLQDGATSMNMDPIAFNNLVGITIWLVITVLLLFAFKGSYLAALISAPVLVGVSYSGLLIPVVIVILAVLNVLLLLYALLPRGTG